MPDGAIHKAGGPAPPPQLPTRTSVLLIEGDPASRDASRTALEQVGLAVRCADNGYEATQSITRHAPDVMIIDAESCSGEGWLVWTRRLEAIVLREIPTILLATSDLDLNSLDRADSSVEEWLLKPFRTHELVLRVQLVADRRRRHRDRLGLREIRAEQARMWDVLLEFSRSLGRALELDSVLDRLVMAAAEMACSRRVSLMLPDERHEFLRIAKSIGIDEQTAARVRLPIGEAIAGQAFASRRRLTAADTHVDAAEGEYPGQAFVSMPIMAMSLTAVEQSVGVLNITQRYGDRPFEDWELEFIDLLGGVAGSVIDDTMWRQARDSLLKYDRDLQLARRIQQATFPKQLPSVDGFDIAAWSEPAEETGGDTFDIIGLGEDAAGELQIGIDHPDRAVLLLADATGHGVGPALCVAQVRAMMRMAVRTEPDIARVVHFMNEQLCADLPRGRFVTAWLGELDVATGTLSYFSAGQAPILRYIAASDTVEVLGADTMPLGIMHIDVDGVRPLPMNDGDMVAVISDGIFEAEDETGKLLGVEHVSEVLRTHRDESARHILDALWATVVQFAGNGKPTDDRTAIILKKS